MFTWFKSILNFPTTPQLLTHVKRGALDGPDESIENQIVKRQAIVPSLPDFDIYGAPPPVYMNKNLLFSKYKSEYPDFGEFVSFIPSALTHESNYERLTNDPSLKLRGNYNTNNALCAAQVTVNDGGAVFFQLVELENSDVYNVSRITTDDKFVNPNFPKTKRFASLKFRTELFRSHKERLLTHFKQKVLKELSLIGVQNLLGKNITIVLCYMIRRSDKIGLIHSDNLIWRSDPLKSYTPSHVSVTTLSDYKYSTQIVFPRVKTITFASENGDSLLINNIALKHCTPLVTKSVLGNARLEETHRIEGGRQENLTRVNAVNLLSDAMKGVINDFERKHGENAQSVRGIIRMHTFVTEPNSFFNNPNELISRQVGLPEMIGVLGAINQGNIIIVNNPDEAAESNIIAKFGMGGKRAKHFTLKKRRASKKKRNTLKRGIRNKKRSTSKRGAKYKGGGDGDEQDGVITLPEHASSMIQQTDHVYIPANEGFSVYIDPLFLETLCPV